MLQTIDRRGKKKMLGMATPVVVPPLPPTVSSGDWVTNETPVGVINGSNATFTTLHAFVAGRVKVYINGVGQKDAVDFTTSGTHTINMMIAPLGIDTITTDYIKL